MNNLKSSISNNIFGGVSYIPPNPIGGNIINIGGQGYNNGNMGYYNNTYNGYYNPYLVQRQREIEEAQQRENIQQQADIWKKLSRGCHAALGSDIEDMEEHLKRYDPVPVEQHQEEEHYNTLVNLALHGNDYNARVFNAIESNNRLYEKNKERFPDTTSLSDFMANAGELYAEAMMRETKEQEKDVGRLYNSAQYKKLIGLHNSNAFKDTSIDDMEIQLPNHLATEYQKRKQAFLDGILGK